MNSNCYLAITGDVIRSRDLAEASMAGLRTAIDSFNGQFQPVVHFAIQAGDEIQGLLALDGRPLESICWLLAELYPLTIRWGIGKGAIDSPIRETTADMRGQAFEFSRAALQSANRQKKLVAVAGDLPEQSALNLILALIGGYLVTWDERAFRRFRLYNASRTIYSVAQDEGVSIEAINKNLTRKHIRLVTEGVEFFDQSIMGLSTV